MFPEDIFGKLGKIYGKDKQGHPVSWVPSHLSYMRSLLRYMFRYNLYGANKDLDAVFGDVQRFLR